MRAAGSRAEAAGRTGRGLAETVPGKGSLPGAGFPETLAGQ